MSGLSAEAWIALAALLWAVLTYLAARLGTSKALTIHLGYLRRDVDKALDDSKAAHWRLDRTAGAPPAPDY